MGLGKFQQGRSDKKEMIQCFKVAPNNFNGNLFLENAKILFFKNRKYDPKGLYLKTQSTEKKDF